MTVVDVWSLVLTPEKGSTSWNRNCVGCARVFGKASKPQGAEHPVTDLHNAPRGLHPFITLPPSLIYCRMYLQRSAVALVLVIGSTAGLGDRFAWSPVEVAEDTREGKLVAEVDEVVRNVRKVAEEDEKKESKEEIEGRFVGKEVLCSLGLADVSMRKSNQDHRL